jgi:signal recognition particle subunit SEC65
LSPRPPRRAGAGPGPVGAKYELLRPLANTDHDAQAVADVLDKLGFDVAVESDRSYPTGRAASARWRRDVVVSHYKLADAGIEPRLHFARALELAEAMREKGMLAPADAFILDMLRDKLAKLP